MTRCPGQDFRKLTVSNVECPECGKMVEMFSDELRLRCPYCKTMVYKEQMPSCVQWCPAARDCVGPELYEALTGKSVGDQASREEKVQTGSVEVLPTEMLEQEHRLIKKVLDVAQHQAELIHGGQGADFDKIGDMVDFFREFADRCHHAKEEDLLFARMGERGMSATGTPIEVMLKEHQSGRELVQKVSEALPAASRGDSSAQGVVSENLLAYVKMLKVHIDKEDRILYPLANRLLTEADQQELADEFDRLETEENAGSAHEKYRRLAVRLVTQ